MHPAMGRRDFLLLRRVGPERVLELSCERLYMRWADASSGAGGATEATRGGRTDSNESGSSGPNAPRAEPWEGEPPSDIVTTSPEALFQELERSLADADVLKLRHKQWLADFAFALEVESRVEAFRSRGGRVE